VGTSLSGELTVVGNTTLAALSAYSLTLSGTYSINSLSLSSLTITGNSGAAPAVNIVGTGNGSTALSITSTYYDYPSPCLSVSITGSASGTALSVTGNSSMYGLNLGTEIEMGEIDDSVAGEALWTNYGINISGVTILKNDLHIGDTSTSTLVFHHTNGDVNMNGILEVGGDVKFTSLPSATHGGTIKYLLVDTSDGMVYYES